MATVNSSNNYAALLLLWNDTSSGDNEMMDISIPGPTASIMKIGKNSFGISPLIFQLLSDIGLYRAAFYEK
jgi:hypothetical protein